MFLVLERNVMVPSVFPAGGTQPSASIYLSHTWCLRREDLPGNAVTWCPQTPGTYFLLIPARIVLFSEARFIIYFFLKTSSFCLNMESRCSS